MSARSDSVNGACREIICKLLIELIHQARKVNELNRLFSHLGQKRIQLQRHIAEQNCNSRSIHRSQMKHVTQQSVFNARVSICFWPGKSTLIFVLFTNFQCLNGSNSFELIRHHPIALALDFDFCLML